MAHKRRRPVVSLEKEASGANISRIAADDPIGIGIDKSIHVDMSKLPAPSNIYDADFAWIEHRLRAVSLFFGKRNRENKQQLRTCLEIRYPPESLVKNLWGNSRDFHEGLKCFADKWPLDDERNNLDPSRLKPLKEHSEWANFEAMAHAGTEASIDFYQMPPAGIARFAKGQGSSGLKLTPIVRVQMDVFELLRLLDDAVEIVRRIRDYLPQLGDEKVEKLV